VNRAAHESGSTWLSAPGRSQRRPTVRVPHRNRLFTAFSTFAFHATFSDVSLRLPRVLAAVRSHFPSVARFGSRLERSVHALELELAVAGFRTPYYAAHKDRLEAQHLRDGLRIRSRLSGLYRSERPLALFLCARLVLAITSVLLAIPILRDLFRSQANRAAHFDGDSLHRVDAAGVVSIRRGFSAGYRPPAACRETSLSPILSRRRRARNGRRQG